MTQLNAIRKAANDRIHQWNQLARRGQARSLEFATECALEVLAELADELGALAMYQQITNRLHALENYTVLAPITAMGGEA